MEENEKEVEETTTTNEELEETTTDEVEEETNEDDSNDSPSLEDYLELKKQAETLKAQKEHWRKKATSLPKKESNKSNETQSSLSREEAILYAKGYTDEEVELANKLSKVNGTNVLVAIEDDFFKSKVALRKKKENAEKASLPASSGVGKFKADKPVGEMSEDEHQKYFHKVMGN